MNQNQIRFDKDRRFYLAKIADGDGNCYIFNVPPDVRLTVKGIMKAGELISFKEGSKPYKRMDSSTDRYYGKYSALPALNFSGAQWEQEVLQECRRNAPLPGKETRRPLPPKAVDSESPTQSEAAHADTKQPETFKGHVVLRDDTGIYVYYQKNCECGVVIPGKRTVSVGPTGEFTSFQAFRTAVKGAGPIRPGSKEWQCPKCKGVETNVEAKRKQVTEPVERQPTTVEGKRIQGRNKAYFIQDAEGTYWYAGKYKLAKSDRGGLEFRKEQPCTKCGSKITLRGTVSVKDGLPFNPAGFRPSGQKAKPETLGSQNWVCESCLTGKTKQPATPSPEEVTLHDVVAAARAAGADVTVDLIPKEAPPPPPPLPHPVGLSAAHRTALEKLEGMALDENINDKMFRGAAWMLARALGGGLL